MTSWVKKSNIPPAGCGHNRSPVGGEDLQCAIDSELTGFGAEYINCPHIDVDPNIGLMLLMGLSNRLTVRKEMLSRDHPIDGKIDTQTPSTMLVDAIEQAQREGKTRMTIMLRFPNTHSNGQRFNKIHGVKNVGNCVEVPVVIDVSPASIDEWKADTLRTPINGNHTGGQHADDSTKLARKYGFADERAMQNSYPLALNNYWLNINESRQKSHSTLLAERQKEHVKLSKEITSEQAEIERFKQKIAEPLPSDAIMAENAELVDLALEEFNLLHARKERQQKELDILRLRAREERFNGSNDANIDLKKAIKSKAGEVRTTNRAFAKVQNLYREALLLSPEFVERKRSEWRTIIEYKQEKVTRLTTLLEQCETQIAELGNEPSKHVYAATDRNPNLMSLTVVAANRDAVIHEISAASVRGEPIVGRPKSVQPLYKALYDRVLDDSPNGWLADALDPKRPENYYLRSTRRYFEHMYHEAKKNGSKCQNFSDFATDPESCLSASVAELRHQAATGEARAAERKSAAARG